eukprot:887414-Prymnesium_polylepis.1
MRAFVWPVAPSSLKRVADVELQVDHVIVRRNVCHDPQGRAAHDVVKRLVHVLIHAGALDAPAHVEHVREHGFV